MAASSLNLPPALLLLVLCLRAVALQAGNNAPLSPGKEERTPAQELRGWWVDAFHPGIKSPQEVHQLVTEARAGHFNSLFVQVIRRGDAYYHSNLLPLAADISPSFDPLAELIEEAHSGSPRIEIHAWMVMFPAWGDHINPPPASNHVMRLHPDWLTRSSRHETWDGQGYCLDPGHPEVQRHLLRIATELLQYYQIDGLHLDYIRYSGRGWGYNPVSVGRFLARSGRDETPAPDDAEWLQFRRDQVSGLVRRIYFAGLRTRPAARLSAATICFSPGPATLEEWPHSAAFADKLQDWRGWLEEGILDTAVPMAYFVEPNYAEAWRRWSRFAKENKYHRQVALGIGSYLNSLSDGMRQLRSVRDPASSGASADGMVCYSYAAPTHDHLSRSAWIQQLTRPQLKSRTSQPLFASRADTPPMGWKTAPKLGSIEGYVRPEDQTEGIDGATVEVSGPVHRTLKTAADGWYGIVDLPPGDYRVRASHPPFEPMERDSSVLAGRITASDVNLEPPLSEDL